MDWEFFHGLPLPPINKKMTFTDFISKDNRRQIRNSFPDYFTTFQNDLSSRTLIVKEESGGITLEFFKNDLSESKINLNEYLDGILGNHIEKMNDRLIKHYETNNKFKDNLPLFIIRRHGSYSGDEGSLRRRRGWLVKFNNAWVVYADNFFPRHFFESTYFVDSGSDSEFTNLNLDLKMPYSSGGGRFEKKHRIFPTLTHLSASSNIYLSHLHDLNQSNYWLSNTEVSATTILGNNSDYKFGYGSIQNWDNGVNISTDKNYRIIDNNLSNDEIQFLKAYNVRMLSPFNYFPFPKDRHLKFGSLNGESHRLREHVAVYFENKYKESFNKFRQTARISN